MPELFDTHFHLAHDDDLERTLHDAQLAGVAHLAAIASDLEESRRLAMLQHNRTNLVSSAGVHPHNADKFSDDPAKFEDLIREFNVAAVGEIGLDYHYEFSDRNRQRHVFTTFLELARSTRRPAIVHCREAEHDCFEILRDLARELPAVVLHSFTGTPDWLERFLELDTFISFNGIVTFKQADNVRELLAKTPLDRMLLETDAPYLAPIPHRGKPNRPALLPHTARFIAAHLNMSFDELAERTTRNAQAFFGLTAAGS